VGEVQAAVQGIAGRVRSCHLRCDQMDFVLAQPGAADLCTARPQAAALRRLREVADVLAVNRRVGRVRDARG